MGFSRSPELYHRGRPSYHPEVAKRIAERYHGQVIELGAGTGLFTRQLIDEGLPVIALEPVAAMRSALAEHVPEADVRVGAAESLPLNDRSVDTAVAAQAFHWFDAPAVLEELERVLRVGGHLVTVWNVRDESVEWVAEFTRIIDAHTGDTPRHRSMRWRRAIAEHPLFAPIDEWRLANPFLTDVEGVVDRALSTSFIAALPDADREQVAQQIRDLVKPLGATIEFPYYSVLQAWRLIRP